MPSGKYSELLSKLKFMLEAGGCTDEDFRSLSDEAAESAIGVFRSPTEIIAEGRGQNLADATDLLLIGAIVARYGMVMGNPFAGKE